MFPIIVSLKVPFGSQEQIVVDGRGYVADFLIMRKVVVEVDGSSHLSLHQSTQDEKRDENMRKIGLHVLRFTDDEIKENPERCKAKIRAEIERLPVEVRAEAYLPAGHNMRLRGW